MSVKSFRFDWYPKEAHTDFMLLSPEEVGVLIQICNLMYLHHGPIPNDGKWIARNFDGIGTASCNRIIRQLIDKEHIYITEDGKLSKLMCERQIEVVKERREFYASHGEKGGKKNKKTNQKFSKTKVKNKQKQHDTESLEAVPISSEVSKILEQIPSLNVDIFSQFLEFRHSIGKPIHKNFIPNIVGDLKKLVSLGESPNKVIEQSIKNGWTSLQPVKEPATPEKTYQEKKKEATVSALRKLGVSEGGVFFETDFD